MSLSLKKISDHWELMYENKETIQTGWYQPVPKISLDLIASSQISYDALIIDVGGGDSLLVDHLLAQGYKNITVVDIAENALDRARKRLGQEAERVNWICQDIRNFEPEQHYDLWHDRACFHFLTDISEREVYRQKVLKSLVPSGNLILGAFSKEGPTQCSGLPVKQYNWEEMQQIFDKHFELVESLYSDHMTPMKASQNYVFCSFKKK